MKAGQPSDEQIVAVLQEAARGEKTVATLCQEEGISEATFYGWRKKFNGTSTKEVQMETALNFQSSRLSKVWQYLIATPTIF